MSEEMRKVTREATAYHEAGHVVALIVQGLTFTSATIRPDEDTNSNGASRHPPVYGYYYDGMRDRRAMARKMAVASCTDIRRNFWPIQELMKLCPRKTMTASSISYGITASAPVAAL